MVCALKHSLSAFDRTPISHIAVDSVRYVIRLRHMDRYLQQSLLFSVWLYVADYHALPKSSRSPDILRVALKRSKKWRIFRNHQKSAIPASSLTDASVVTNSAA